VQSIRRRLPAPAIQQLTHCILLLRIIQDAFAESFRIRLGACKPKKESGVQTAPPKVLQDHIPGPRTPASATDRHGPAFQHWKVISSVSSIGKERNTGVASSQSALAGRRVLVAEWQQPLFFWALWGRGVAPVCWGLIHSRKNPLMPSNRALGMPFESLMGGDGYIDLGKINALIPLSPCAPCWKPP
jgi:hypothetical protein